MNKQFKTLLILMVMITVTVNLSNASDNNPNELKGDCSECLTNPAYLNYFRQAEAGSMIATYQAAAALIECYMQNGCFGNSTGYSYDELMRMYNQNMETARELEGEQPYIKLPDSEPENDNENSNNNNSDDDSGSGRIKVRRAN